MVASLSSLGTGRLNPPGKISGTHSFERLNRSQGHSAASRIKLVKISDSPSWIEPEIFRFVIQCVNQRRYRVPRWRYVEMGLEGTGTSCVLNSSEHDVGAMNALLSQISYSVSLSNDDVGSFMTYCCIPVRQCRQYRKLRDLTKEWCQGVGWRTTANK